MSLFLENQNRWNLGNAYTRLDKFEYTRAHSFKGARDGELQMRMRL